MSGKCYECERSFERFSGKISFVYDGFDFTCPGSGIVCSECSKDLIIKDFERLGREIVILKDGDVRVDWKVYYLYDSEQSDHNNDVEVMKEVLLSLGILSYTATGNWEVRDLGMSLNPTRGLSKTYFTRKEDVIDYACSFYRGAVYDWRIFRIAEVLPKSDVLKKCFENK